MKKGLWYYNTVALTPMGYPIGLITGWIGPWVLRGTFHGASHGIPRDVTDAIELPMRCSTRQPIYTMFPVKEVPRGVLWDVQWDSSMAWPRGIPMRQHGIFHGLLGHPMGISQAIPLRGVVMGGYLWLQFLCVAVFPVPVGGLWRLPLFKVLSSTELYQKQCRNDVVCFGSII